MKNRSTPRATRASRKDEIIVSGTPRELPRQNGTNRWLVLAKLLFGTALLVALVLKADILAIVDRLRSVDLYYLAVMFIVPHLMIMVSTVKWQIFLRELSLNLSFRRLFGLYMIAAFFNNFLPTMVGGDAVRVYSLGRETKATSAVAAATLMERLIGFAALISFLPLALLSRTVTENFPAVWYLIPAAALGFTVASWVVLSTHWLRLAHPMRKIPFVDRVVGLLARIHGSVRLAARSSVAVSTTFVLSAVFYVGAAVSVWAAARSLGAEVGMTYLLATVPLVLVAGMLPISLNGLGVTEAGFAIFLQAAGVSLTDAVGVALLLRGRLLITGLLGGLVFLRYRATRGQN
jgi:hypothetical protein